MQVSGEYSFHASTTTPGDCLQERAPVFSYHVSQRQIDVPTCSEIFYRCSNYAPFRYFWMLPAALAEQLLKPRTQNCYELYSCIKDNNKNNRDASVLPKISVMMHSINIPIGISTLHEISLNMWQDTHVRVVQLSEQLGRRLNLKLCQSCMLVYFFNP